MLVVLLRQSQRNSGLEDVRTDNYIPSLVLFSFWPYLKHAVSSALSVCVHSEERRRLANDNHYALVATKLDFEQIIT